MIKALIMIQQQQIERLNYTIQSQLLYTLFIINQFKLNQMISKQKFIIMVRVRPRIKEDSIIYSQSDMESILENDHSSINIQRKHNQEKIFKFNHIFNPGNQKEVYQKASHLVEAIFQGHNSTFLAYGQTGTGKTHTIFGSEGTDSGYFYLSVDDIFSTIKRRLNQRQFAVRVSFVQFYLDNIYDLLDGSHKKLQIKQNSQDGIHIKDLTQVSVRNSEELLKCMKKAVKQRKTQQTSLNKRSSRSHAVIQIAILQRWNEGGQTKYLKGMLKIVDLAGSERVSKTESNGNRLQEAKRINKEITTLGKCINLLAQAEKQHKTLTTDLNSKFNFNKSYIPFRDAKITRYLSQSLEGKSKIILCACISGFSIHLQQSFSSLMFASQASTLKIDSIRNEPYSLSIPKKIADRQNTSYETPLRGKTQLKKQDRNSFRQRISTESVHSINKVEMKTINNVNGQKLLQKFKRQLHEINQYLEKKEINTKTHSRQILQANLLSMHKIFNIIRQKNQPSFY